MEAVYQVSAAAILGRKEVFSFLYHKPFVQRPLILWLSWIWKEGREKGGGEGREGERVGRVRAIKSMGEGGGGGRR